MHPAYDGQMHTQMELLAEFSLPYAQELPTADAHHALESGTASDIHSCHAPAYDYVYDYEDSLHSLQVSGARATRDLRDWPNWNVACYSLNGRRAAHFRQHMATLLEKCLDADIGLADDITDRALQAHMADLNAAKEASTGNVGEIPGSNPETAPRNWVRSSSRQAHHPRLQARQWGVNTPSQECPQRRTDRYNSICSQRKQQGRLSQTACWA